LKIPLELNESIYRNAQYDFLDFRANPQYSFYVVSGINMDQRRSLRFGTRQREDMVEKMTGAGLRLAEIDIAASGNTWAGIIAEDTSIINGEMDKIAVYLSKLDRIDAYLGIVGKPGGNHIPVWKDILNVPVAVQQGNLIDRTRDYLALTMDLLKEIKNQAGLRLKNLNDKRTRSEERRVGKEC
jgi:hypothetical protein